ncbi:hypothetical protein [Halochromatium roseum]|uniref:hypothetical protein n=1 Tax=Halochromatium roseum TaxID=391920 RepID=UPI001914B97B|nr:hypothetical protein [Halochromatium roseum]MBK5940358.1 galactosyl transferase [Halochromatium roseum]
MTLLTFIVPVRHQDNARDWDALTGKLSETVRSIAAQTHPDWRGIVVANVGAVLPPLPDKFSICRVTFPPNDLHELGQGGKAAFLDAFRADKGRRVLAGMLDARQSRYTMICDDDDLVSNRITEYVAQNPSANGWVVTRGWLWNDGGRYLFEYNDFNHKCGTCLIVRRDLYEIPETFEEADLEWIKDSFGSHHRIDKKLAACGTPLLPLPFRGAVYRVGNTGSHSGTSTILHQALLNGSTIRRPKQILRNLLGLRWIGRSHRQEFFGG